MRRREPEPERVEAPASRRWTALALALFAACLFYVFLPIWAQGFTEVVPSVGRTGAARKLAEADVLLGVWGASRNAWVLSRAPGRFFEAESCFPTRRSLTLGHPMLSLGVLGVPVRLVAPDPVATYNGV